MSPEEREERVKAIKEWYLKQPHLPKGIDERLFLSFVTGTKSLEKAKRKLDTYFTVKHTARSFVAAEDPTDPALVEAAAGHKMFFLPGTTPEKYKVLFETYTGCDPSKYSHPYSMLHKYFLMDYAFHEWPLQESYIMVMDINHLQMSKVSFQLAIKVLLYALKAYPKKLKKVIVLNIHPAAEKITQLIISMAPKKMQSRGIIVDRNKNVLEELHKHVPRKMLPSDYGGEMDSSAKMHDDWMKTLATHKDWFRARFQEASDETKRPPDSLAETALDFGIDGSFRTLTID